jgi:carboxyvinyl-carboxyphosphonate phosphorylmutase
MAAVQAVHDTLAALRAGESPQSLKGVASNELMQRVMRNEDYMQWIKDWL